MEKDRYIYGLFVDGNEYPSYIGLGKGRRMHGHVQEALRGTFGSNLKCLKIIETLNEGKAISPRKLADMLTLEEAATLEASLIASIGREDLGTGPLWNTSGGGLGVHNLAPSTHLKLSKSQIGNKKTLGKRWTVSQDGRANMSRSRLGIKNHLGKPHSDKTKTLISERNIGFKHSLKTCAMRSKMMLGNKIMLGKKLPDKTREKMRAAALAAWARRKESRVSTV